MTVVVTFYYMAEYVCLCEEANIKQLCDYLHTYCNEVFYDGYCVVAKRECNSIFAYTKLLGAFEFANGTKFIYNGDINDAFYKYKLVNVK